MNRNKIFRDLWDMEDIFKDKMLGSSINCTLTNASDLQTCSVADLEAIVAVVVLTHVETLSVAGDVVGCARIHVPVGFNLVRGDRVIGGVVFLLSTVGVIEAAVAAEGDVADLVADLTDRARGTAARSIASVVASLVRLAATEAAASSLSTTMASIVVAASIWVAVLASLSTLAATAALVSTAGEVRRRAAPDDVVRVLDIMTMLISKQM